MTFALKSAIRFSIATGLLLFFSACNESTSDSAPTYPQSNTSQHTDAPPVQLGTGGEGGTKAPPPDGAGDRGIVLQQPANLVLTPSTYDFGIQSAQSSTHIALTVSNDGELAARSIQPSGFFGSFGFRQGSYPGFRGTCTDTLLPGSSCILWLTFSPSTTGTFSTSLASLVYDSGRGSRTTGFSLTGRAMNIATLRFSNLVNDDALWNFGSTLNGSTVRKTIHVQYFGTKTASGVTFSGVSAPFSIESSTCGTDITADCDLTIAFTPTQAVTISNTLKVTYNNSSFAASDTFTLTGTGNAVSSPGLLTLQDGGNNQWTNPLISGTYDRTFLVTKSGSLPVTGVSPLSFGSAAYAFKGGTYPGTGGTCTETIANSCTIVLTFSPTAAVTYSDSLRLSYNDGVTSQTVSFPFSNTGRTIANLTITPSTYDFGSIPARSALYKTFTIQNTSSGSVASALTFSGLTTGFILSSKTCGTVLNGGASCTVTLRFLPTAVFAYSSPFNVSYFNGSVTKSDISVSLTGNGVADALLASSLLTLPFGNVPINTTTTRSFVLNYYGTNPATVSNVTITGAGFSFAGGAYPGTGGTCTNSITVTCSIYISFNPTLTQNYSGSFSLTYDTGTGTSQSITVGLTGAGVSSIPALLTTTASLFTFSKTPALQTNSLTVTLSRTGSFSATSISLTGMSLPFRFKGGSYPGTGGSCGTVLSGSSCNLVFEFAPSIDGTFEQLLSLNYYDGFSTQSLPFSLRGSSYLRAVLAATGFFNLGRLPISGSTTSDITITNQGQGTATSITPAINTPFEIAQSTCGNTLAASTSCQLRVRFSSNVPGNYMRPLSIGYFEGDQTTAISNNTSATATVPVLLSTNGNHACTRTETGTLRCWGHNNYGQLGYENTTNRLDSGTGPLPDINLGANRWVKSVATGYWHTCVILDDNSVRCWGSNQYGQLGIGQTDLKWGDRANTMGALLPQVNLGTPEIPTALSLGYAHSCALFDTGKLKCWGQNSEGQLGLEDTLQRGTTSGQMGTNLPYISLGGANVTQVAAGESHTCALLDDQTVKCWGNNFFGQLGLGDFSNRGDSPSSMGNNLNRVSLGSGLNIASISVGGAFSCARFTNGSVKCWGRNENGILGNTYCLDAGGATGSCSSPGFSTSLRGLGISSDQLGDALPFIDLGVGNQVAQISSSNSSTCALLSNGGVKCWGLNDSGQLGLGDVTARGLTPSQMGNALPSLSLGMTAGVQRLHIGGIHACALSVDEKIKCWGDNRYGTLGLGDSNNRGDAPGEMGTSLGFVAY